MKTGYHAVKTSDQDSWIESFDSKIRIRIWTGIHGPWLGPSLEISCWYWSAPNGHHWFLKRNELKRWSQWCFDNFLIENVHFSVDISNDSRFSCDYFQGKIMVKGWPGAEKSRKKHRKFQSIIIRFSGQIGRWRLSEKFDFSGSLVFRNLPVQYDNVIMSTS